MPKRKRNPYDTGGCDRNLQRQNQDVQEELTQSKKLLHRALKTAKGFERQKLGKRLKHAQSKGETEEIARINREIEIVKTLDLDRTTDAHIHKTLLKIKAFAESELLPDEVRKVLPKPAGGDEILVALYNVTSGIINTKPVKDAMRRVLSKMYTAIGVPEPAVGEKKQKSEVKVKKEDDDKFAEKKVKEDLSPLVDENRAAPRAAARLQEESIVEESDEGSADVSGSEGYSEVDLDDEEEEDDDEAGGVSLDEDTLAHYDAFLGASSDEESFDEQEYKSRRPPETTPRLSLSLSPEPDNDVTPSPSISLASSSSPSPELQPKSKTKTTKPTKSKEATKVGGSTFLPTLMGGYWSGSEESASDLEEEAPPPKKNRPGQMARRAIWEKKYGSNASHIKEGKGPVPSLADRKKGKDDGWDEKRGAKDNSRGRGGARGGGRSFDGRGTGENALPVGEVKKKKTRDDVGVLHPSWQAAKKAKEEKKMATFQGKKVTF